MQPHQRRSCLCLCSSVDVTHMGSVVVTRITLVVTALQRFHTQTYWALEKTRPVARDDRAAV